MNLASLYTQNRVLNTMLIYKVGVQQNRLREEEEDIA